MTQVILLHESCCYIPGKRSILEVYFFFCLFRLYICICVFVTLVMIVVTCNRVSTSHAYHSLCLSIFSARLNLCQRFLQMVLCEGFRSLIETLGMNRIIV